MTVERAILLTVGGLIIVSVLLAVYVNISWLWLTGLLGAHLVQASFTGKIGRASCRERVLS